MSDAEKGPAPSGLPEIPESVYSGNEAFFSSFSQAQVCLSTLRLTLEDRVITQTGDLASMLENSKRSFQHTGDCLQALQDVQRIESQLHQRVQSWEREIQNQQRGKFDKSGGQIQRLKAEIGRIRVQIQVTERALSKLIIVLNQLSTASYAPEPSA